MIRHKIGLFCSSYIPLFLLMLIKNFFERIFPDDKHLICWDDIVNMPMFVEAHDFVVIIIFLVAIISYLYLKKIIIMTESVNSVEYMLCKVENKSSEYFMNYIAVYLLPCVGLSLNKIPDIAVFFFVMCIIGYIYIECNLIYMNPVLNMMGYRIYYAELRDANNNSAKNFETVVVAHASLEMIAGEIHKGTIKDKNQFIFMKKKCLKN